MKLHYLLMPNAAAQLLHCSRTHVRRMCAKGALRSYRFPPTSTYRDDDGDRRILMTDVIEMLKKMSQPVPEECYEVTQPRVNFDQPVFTTGDVGKICCCAGRTVIKWIDAGILKGYVLPLSSDRRVPRESLIEFLRAYEMYIPARLTDPRRHALYVGRGPIECPEFNTAGMPCELAAAQHAVKRPPHALVVDLIVGRSQGVKLARLLAAPVSVALASEDEGDVKELLAAFTRVLRKPVPDGEILEALREATCPPKARASRKRSTPSPRPCTPCAIA